MENSRSMSCSRHHPYVLQSPVTEVLLAYFPSDISAAEKEVAGAQFEQLVRKSLNGCLDVKGVSYGWGTENDFPVRGEKGQVGSVLMAFIGWPSVEASLRKLGRRRRLRRMWSWSGTYGRGCQVRDVPY
jgi:hypothetical protein